MRKIKRRQISNWTEHTTAKKDYECVRCEELISAYSEYLRYVFVSLSGKRLEVEREHTSPGCC